MTRGHTSGLPRKRRFGSASQKAEVRFDRPFRFIAQELQSGPPAVGQDLDARIWPCTGCPPWSHPTSSRTAARGAEPAHARLAGSPLVLNDSLDFGDRLACLGSSFPSTQWFSATAIV